jgi:hypothetical protein
MGKSSHFLTWIKSSQVTSHLTWLDLGYFGRKNNLTWPDWKQVRKWLDLTWLFIYDQVTSQVQNCIYNQSKKYPDTPIFFDLRRPNQHLWSSLKRKMSNHNPKDLDELWNSLKIEWTNIQKHECKKLVDNYSNRLPEVIKQKGGPTRY